MNKILHIVGAIALVAACGGDDGSTFGKDGGNGNGEGGLGDFDSGLSGNGDGGGNGGDGGGNNCYAPVDMYIIQDRSGSMGTDCNIGDNTNSKWCHSVNALSGYFKSPKAAGNAVALQFFPLPNHQTAWCGTGDNYHLPASPTTPPPYTTLPTPGFDMLLNQQNASGNTPTEAAIRGITRYTAANRRGGRVTIGILVTDGDPNGCDENLGNLSGLLQAHFAATQLRTFVIGMNGADFNNLEAIAQGGNGPMHPDTVGTLTNACGNGNGPCRHWNVGDGNPDAFIAALAAIQEASDGCKDGGGVVNPPN